MAGEVIPDSAGGDVFVPLDDVWNTRHVEARWLQPLHPRFNTAISSISAFLAFQACAAASGSVFLRAKRREFLLAHSKVPIPEPQKRALIVTPGSDSGVFSEPLLDSVAAQVKEDSLVSSSLAVSKALASRSGFVVLASGWSVRFQSSSTGPAVRKALCVLFALRGPQALQGW